MSASGLVQLAPEHHAALTLLADKDGVGLAEWLGRAIGDAAMCELADPLPGWHVSGAGGRVRLDHADGIRARMRTDDARSLATMIRDAAKKKGKFQVIELDAQVGIERVGRALRVVDMTNAAHRTVSWSVAHQLADLLGRAASAADRT